MKIGELLGQGDVTLMKVNAPEIEGFAAMAPDDQGRVVLAYGEVTGHAHAFYDRGVRMFRDDGLARMLIIDKTSELRHEEHGTVAVPPGTYKVLRPVEYSPQALRQVVD